MLRAALPGSMHHQSKTKASRKVADHGSYCIIHDQFIDHYSAGGLRPLESLAWAWARAPVLRAALPGSMHHQSKTKASRKVADHGSYCIIHDQFIDHYSAGGLRPLESLAWAWARAPVLRAALPGSMHHQSKTKASRKVADHGSYCIIHDLSIYLQVEIECIIACKHASTFKSNGIKGMHHA